MCSAECTDPVRVFRGIRYGTQGISIGGESSFHRGRVLTRSAVHSVRGPFYADESTSPTRRRPHGRKPACCKVCREAMLEAPQQAAALKPADGAGVPSTQVSPGIIAASPMKPPPHSMATAAHFGATNNSKGWDHD